MNNVRPVDIMNSMALLLGLILMVGCTSEPENERTRADEYMIKAVAQADAARSRGGTVLNVGFVVLESVYNSELMAPYDVIQHTVFRDENNYMMPFIVSPDGHEIVSFEGIEIRPHYSFETSPPIDVLIIPSTEHSMTQDLENEPFMEWLHQAVEEATYVITVCDGAFPLAATGALDGKIATTFPGDRDRFAEMFPEVDVRYDVNFVEDGKFITSVGGALSYEPAFHLVEKIYGVSNARRIGQGLVWDWDVQQVPHLIVSAEDS
ncbi:MAG: DJ-1/PfpI family protein [Rhodothermaceae bacterium]|nr:DJ-1/PfpI family protein [Rhodothermaceae bacterium]